MATNQSPVWDTLHNANHTLPTLGQIVMWRLRGCAITHSDLKNRLDPAGFVAYLPKPPSAHVALRRAITAWIAEGGNGRRNRLATDDDEETTPIRALIRPIRTGHKRWLTFGLVLEKVDLVRMGLDYGTDLRIFLDKDTDHIILTTEDSGDIVDDNLPPTHPLAADLERWWLHYKALHTAGDLARIVRQIVGDMSSMGLRREGGVYFVPITYNSGIERLRAFVEGLPQDAGQVAYLFTNSVIDEKEARRNLAKAVHTGFMDQIAALQGDLRDLRAKGNTTRSTSISERLVTYRKLREKLEIYAGLLDFQKIDILDGIAQLRADAMAAITDSEDTESGYSEIELGDGSDEQESGGYHHLVQEAA